MTIRQTLKRFLAVVGSVLIGRYRTSLAVEVDIRVTKLMAVSPSADEALLRLDQAVLIAQCGGISTEKLEALLHYGVWESMQLGVVRHLEDVGISTTKEQA